MKLFFVSITLLLLLASCGKDSNDNPEPTTAQRTVVVFMSADNSLSEYGFPGSDFQELVNGSYNTLTANDRLVVFMDRISSTERPFIARITGNQDHPVDTLYKYGEDPYVTDTDVFTEILSRCATLCPAKEYGLVLWGHASGWSFDKNTRRSYGIDNGNRLDYSDAGVWLSIPDMRVCFERLGIKWKFVFADCCNMMCAEVAYELRNNAEYLIGSPAEIPGMGAPYHKLLPWFFSQSDNFYEGIVDEYAKYYPNNRDDIFPYYVPLTVVRLDQMESLATATRAVLPAVAEHLRQGDDVATSDIIYYYSPGGQNDKYNKAMYDMNDMLRTALANQPEAYAEWHQALSKAVVKAVKASSWQTSFNNGKGTVDFDDFTVTDDKQGGISMFFPLDKYYSSSCKYTFNTDIRNMQWYQAVGWSSVGY